MASRQSYCGLRRKLVLAFDVGTTFSGISYSILDPGSVPEIKGVTKFPAQDQVSGSSKIPTLLYYDRAGNACAIGAEALSEGVYETAEDEQWHRTEWFKLHLRPRRTDGNDITTQLPPLPPGKTAVHVLADFLAYLFRCARSYIQETHANGAALWRSVEAEIEFVLSHPNGWEGFQQEQMRKAAVLAGLVPDDEHGQARISFVTEGEASLHFAIQNGLPKSALEGDNGVVIVDAGGGTIDISAYGAASKVTSQAFDEVAVPQCHFQGSIFVSIHARVFLEDSLAESPFIDDLDHIIRCFDKTTKLRFRNKNEPQFIKFGSTRDNDEEHGIRYGQLKLNGSDVAEFFEPSIQCIVRSVREQKEAARKKFTNVVLVGGFAASDWMYSRVTEALGSLGLEVLRPDSHVNKAVADGALSFYLDHHVTTRVSRMTYGNRGGISYNPSKSEHAERAHLVFTATSGVQRLGGVFWVLLPYNHQVSETKEFRRTHFWEFKRLSDLSTATSNIWCYRGDAKDGAFIDSDTDGFQKLCTIEVDLSNVTPETKTAEDGSGRVYYKVKYDSIMLFGGTELKAQIAWQENGVERRSPAKILYSS